MGSDKYSCKMQSWEGSERGYCIFHDPDPEKLENLFIDTLIEQQNGNSANSKNIFIGYIFPSDVEIFKNYTFKPLLDPEMGWEDEDVLENHTGKESVVDFRNAKFRGKCSFRNTLFSGPSLFAGAVFYSFTSFKNVVFEDDVNFNNTVFRKKVDFTSAEFSGLTGFESSRFSYESNFSNSVFNFVSFKNSVFNSQVDFQFVRFMKESFFDYCVFQGTCNLFDSFFNRDTSFNNVQFNNKCNLTFCKFEGLIYCKEAKFLLKRNKELICRKARKSWESEGDRKEADFYYRNEMIARRKQLGSQQGLIKTLKKLFSKEFKKPNIKSNILFIFRETDWRGYLLLLKRFFEWLLVDITTSYGTRWLRVLLCWSAIILGFACYYTLSQGLQLESEITFFKGLYFSIVSFATLGYGDIVPRDGLPQIVAGIESLLGAIFIAIFVVVFGRKFMG